MEDARKAGLKSGIRQLTSEQIQRTLDYPGEMALDHGNYVDGKFCPLAVGAGLDKLPWKTPPTDSAVTALLHILGFRVNNTRGLRGKFFRKNRLRDYRCAACEVLGERP
jgi:hypothetical protein